MHRSLVWVFPLAVAAGCHVLPAQPTGEPSQALTDTAGTTLGRLLAEPCARHPCESSLTVLDRPKDAFLARIALVDLAERSIDLQYYCWYSDTVGRLLVERLMRAADRGVRVRLLVDDIELAGRDSALAALDRHPNIEIRLFNPFRVRFNHPLLRTIELVLNLDRLNHRMHNKTFVVDNRFAIVGGRNIADEYFGLNPKFDFRDLDLLAGGPAAAQVSECFDAYWNSPRVFTAADVGAVRSPEQERQARDRLQAFAAERWKGLDYGPLPDCAGELEILRQAFGHGVWAHTEMLFDDPTKLPDIDQPSQIRERLANFGVQREIEFVNPYFVPQEKAVDALLDLRRRGVDVRILTNSLASTDVVPVHAGYSKRRKPLLEGGAGLCELRIDAESKASQIASGCSDARLALHCKVIVADRSSVFVGSMNMDPRSHRLNTEDGLLVRSPELAERVLAALEPQFREDSCWRPSLLCDGRMVWTTQRAGTQVTAKKEPDASWGRRVKVRILKALPIENQL